MKEITIKDITIEDVQSWLLANDYNYTNDTIILDTDGERLTPEIPDVIYALNNLVESVKLEQYYDWFEDSEAIYQAEYIRPKHTSSALNLGLEIAPFAESTQNFGFGRGYYINYDVIEMEDGE